MRPEVPRCGDCPDQAGQVRCQEGRLAVCGLESPTSDCLSWRASDCGPGFTCQGEPAACTTTCAAGHACQAGATRCTAEGLQAACGLVDGCLAWLAPAACPGGVTCDCEVGATRCTADGRQQACAVTGSCPTWQPPVACQAGTTCPAEGATCQPYCAAAALSSTAPGRLQTACALLDGRAWCWGRDDAGQLGDGATAQWRTAPVQATALGEGLAQVAVLTAGGTTCARTAAGAVRCVGSNALGALGAGSDLEASSAALPVSGLSGAVDAGGRRRPRLRGAPGRLAPVLGRRRPGPARRRPERREPPRRQPGHARRPLGRGGDDLLRRAFLLRPPGERPAAWR